MSNGFYKEKQAQLEELKRLDEPEKIDLYYLDESGFSLIRSVPYGWQNIGEYLTISSRRSRRLNVLGIMNRKNDLKSYVSFQSINSEGACHFCTSSANTGKWGGMIPMHNNDS